MAAEGPSPNRRQVLRALGSVGVLGGVAGADPGGASGRGASRESGSVAGRGSPPGIEWQERYGGSADDRALSVIQTSDGGYLFVGTTGTAGGSADGWAVKVTDSGRTQWEQTYATDGNDVFASVVEASGGGYLLAGLTDGGQYDGFDAWLVAADESGTEQSQDTFGGDADDGFTDIATPGGGGSVLVGQTGSFADNKAAWVVTGDWSQYYSGNGNYGANGVVPTGDGDYLIAGWTDDDDVSSGERSAWLASIDGTNSDIQWQNTFGGNGRDEAKSVIRTSDGGYMLVGQSEPAGALGDVWLVKVDSRGNKQWDEHYGTDDTETGYEVVEAPDGGYLACGTRDTGGNNGTDAWLVKTDANGAEQWHESYGGVGDDGAFSVLGTDDGGYLFAGWDGSVTDPDEGWLVKLSDSAPTTTTTTSTSTTASTTSVDTTTTTTETLLPPGSNTTTTTTPATTTTTSATTSTTRSTTAPTTDDSTGGGGDGGDDEGSGGGSSLLLPALGGGGVLALGAGAAWWVLGRGDDDGPGPDETVAASGGSGGGGNASTTRTGSDGTTSTTGSDGTTSAAGSATGTGATAAGTPTDGTGDGFANVRAAVEDATGAREAGRHDAAVDAFWDAVTAYGEAVGRNGGGEAREAARTAVLAFVGEDPDPGLVDELVADLRTQDPASAGPSEALVVRALAGVPAARLAADPSVAGVVAGYVRGPSVVSAPAAELLAALLEADPSVREDPAVVPAVEDGLTHDDDETREHCVQAAATIIADSPQDGRPFVRGLALSLGVTGEVGAVAASGLARVLDEYPEYGTEFLPEMAAGLTNPTPIERGYADATVAGKNVSQVVADLVADVTDHDVSHGEPLVAPLIDHADATDADASNRAAAFRALANLAEAYPEAAADAVEVASTALGEANTRVRRHAAELLENVATANPEAVEPVVAELVVAIDDSDNDLRTRAAAMLALGAVGTGMPAAVESDVQRIVGRLDDDSSIIREHAAEVIVSLAERRPAIVEPAAETSDRLRRLQRDPAVSIDRDRLDAAATAIQKGVPVDELDADDGGRRADEPGDGRSGKTRVFGGGDEFDTSVCPECGTSVADGDAAVCPECGTDLD